MRPLPEFTSIQGQHYPTVKDVANCWVHHFAQIEGGYATTPDEVINIILGEHERKSRMKQTRASLAPALQSPD